MSEDPYLHRQPRCPSGSAATSAPAAAQKTGQESVQKSRWRTVSDVRFIHSLPDIMLDQPDTRIPRKRSQSMKVSHWVFYVIFLANPQFSQFSGTYFEQLLQQEVSFRISPRVWTLGSNRTDITLDSLQEESWTTNRCPEIRIFTANLAALPEVQQLQRRQLLKTESNRREVCSWCYVNLFTADVRRIVYRLFILMLRQVQIRQV